MADFCKDNCLNDRCKQCLMAIEELSDDLVYADLPIDYDEVVIYTGLDQVDWDLEEDDEYR